MLQKIIYIKDAIANIRINPLRSLLTLLGVLVGTASVVALLSGGQLATQHALAQFKSLGTDLLSVNIQDFQSSNGSNNSLSVNQIDQLQEASNEIKLIAPYTVNYAPTFFNGQKIDSVLLGATENLKMLLKLSMKEGRFISHLDHDELFSVIGTNIAQQIFTITHQNPIGQQIRVAGNFYTIIGIIEPTTSNLFMFADINQMILIPLQTSLLLGKESKIRNILFKLQENAHLDSLRDIITHQIQQALPNAKLYFMSPEQIIEKMEKQRQTFTLLLGLIGSVSLIVGGIGVMNIMLVSVVERRREIGIRMAVGARQKDIQILFLTEAILLTLLGGTLGVLLGECISFFIAKLSGWEYHFLIIPLLVGFIVSVLVGLFFGFYPAYKASNLDPVETLRAD